MKKIKVQLICAGNDADNLTLKRKNKIGRNDPCPCGSGKKAKNCCGTDSIYTYSKIQQYVEPESTVKSGIAQHYCFEIGDSVIINDKYPVDEYKGVEAVVKIRGIEHSTTDPYYTLEVDGKIYKKWIAEFCIDHLIKQ